VNGAEDRLTRAFAWVVARRVWIAAFYALLLGPAAWLAAQVQQDNSTDRLILPSDPAYVALQEFEKTFGGGEFALLFVDAEEPFDPGVVARVDRLEHALSEVPGLEVNSLLSVYRRARAGFEPTPEQVAGLRAFATGSDLLRRQGLVGDHHLALALTLDIRSTAEPSIARSPRSRPTRGRSAASIASASPG
jgi:hypothetical protein